MSSQLKITIEINDNETFTLSGYIEPGGTVPVSIFLHENDNGQLGRYLSVVDEEEYMSRPVFTPGMKAYGARFVRHDSFSVIVKSQEEIDSFISTITARIATLDSQLQDYPKTITITVGD